MVKSQTKHSGFTIVELLVVIVTVAIIAAISIIAYNGIQSRALAAEASSGLSQAKKKLELYKVDNGNYPTTGNLSVAGVASGDVSFQYTSDGTTYCITGSASSVAYRVTNSTNPTEGVCSGHTAPSGGGAVATGDPIQSVTSSNCPTDRTMVVDARDNRSYWVQKLDDGKCWMLTNLAYAGGGTNTYNDTKTITESSSHSYTEAYYYVPSGASPTMAPSQPSTSTDGTGQYGYLYNWCAAMGAQTATSACANATTPAPSATTSICPSGWRLPTGNSGELGALNTAINSGSTGTDTGLRSAWLAQRGGNWDTAFNRQGSYGYYWSSTQNSANFAYNLLFLSSGVYPTNYLSKSYGFAVRCVTL